MKTYSTLRLILGDQLYAGHSWFGNKEPDTLYLIAELHQEASYVKHHVQKICAFFAAMEAFAAALAKSGHEVLHLTLDETAQYEDLPSLLQALVKTHGIKQVQYQRADEYRLLRQLQDMNIGVPVQEVDSEHFLLPFDELSSYFAQGKATRMEHFYRKMRKRFDILMDGDQPEGRQWNYDQENRNYFKASDLEEIPEPLVFSNPVTGILERLNRQNIQYFGKATPELIWPITRQQSLKQLRYFCQHGLPRFGQFQDAMTHRSDKKWSLYHSRLSFALNSKMLTPMQVIQAAVRAWRADPESISIAQVEGFVRQILGWREYVRGIYWVNMPEYSSLNYFKAQRALPDFFWTGETRMTCLQEAIGQSLDYAYAHHIQRLMITGTFCLLAGIDPGQVDEWYLGIYVDAIEWVELPNTRGMSQFADGGLLASKPYAASGNYINKMSDYCKSCHYDVKRKTGERACPFNSLYWHFMVKHREQLSKNPRIGMIYKNWDKQSGDERAVITHQAEVYLGEIDEL